MSTSISGTSGITYPDATSSSSAPRQAVYQIVTSQSGAVATGTGTIPLDDTIPQISEGNEFMTLAITPTNVNSKLEIDITIVISLSTATSTAIVALFQDSTANALAATYQAQSIATGAMTFTFKHIMTAGTTSSTTFRVRAGATGASTTTFNGLSGGRMLGGVTASRMTIKEYLP